MYIRIYIQLLNLLNHCFKLCFQLSKSLNEKMSTKKRPCKGLLVDIFMTYDTAAQSYTSIQNNQNHLVQSG